MDPLTAVMNLLTAQNALATAIINRAPAEVVGDIITKHEARLDKIYSWAETKFHLGDASK